MHDFSYLLGFTEENFNGQESNFGLTEAFRENDPVLGDTQAGATLPPPGVYAIARNNANMATLPDGSSSITNMYLWQPVAGAFYPPCVDGDFDAGVIGHEYTHMIENRDDRQGRPPLGLPGRRDGRGLGDLVSIEQLNENGLVPTGDENPFATGTYATGNKLRGIRNYAANFPYTGAFPTPGIYPQVDPLNFSDVGYDLTGPEVHADGEIWVAINFELRKALAAKYNAPVPGESDRRCRRSARRAQVPVTQCPGNRRWIQLLFDSFLLMPTDPSMVDARNAILAADQARFGGANQTELWAAFARRGLGAVRVADNTIGPHARRRVRHQPAAGLRGAGPVQRDVTFAATAPAAAPAAKARIYVGHYEARVSPIADTDPATNAPATRLGEQPRRDGGLRARDVRVHRDRPGLRRGALPPDVPGQRRPDDRRSASRRTSRRRRRARRRRGDAAPVLSGPTAPTVQSGPQVLQEPDRRHGGHRLAGGRDAGRRRGLERRRQAGDGRPRGHAPAAINRVQVSALLGPVFDPARAAT